MKYSISHFIIIVAAIGQMFTAVIYPYIRHVVFDWYNDIKKLKPLNQEIAKTYGRYIQGLNFSFGLITILLINELQNGTGLAIALTGLIAAYWIGKVITQFAYYPMYEIPRRHIFKTGEILMNSLFITFAVVFLLLFVTNIIKYIN